MTARVSAGRGGRIRPVAAGSRVRVALREHPQAGDKVAAIDGGDVPRAEGFERFGVVPVENVALAVLQPFERFDRGGTAVNHLSGVRKPKSRAETAAISHMPMLVGEVRSATSTRRAPGSYRGEASWLRSDQIVKVAPAFPGNATEIAPILDGDLRVFSPSAVASRSSTGPRVRRPRAGQEGRPCGIPEAPRRLRASRNAAAIAEM
jgi:hypothetical protein